MTWIDTHVHVWTQDTRRYPAHAGVDVSKWEPKEFTADVVLKYTRPSKVTRVVIVGVYGPDNSLALDSKRQYPDVFAVVGGVDRESKDLEAKMKDLRKQGVKGFRVVSPGETPGEWLNTPAYNNMFEIAVKTGQVICPLTPFPVGLVDLDRMCRQHPKTVIAIDHMGRIGEKKPINDAELDALCALAKHPNVHIKISRLHALGAKRPPHDDLLPMIQRVVNAFGPERCMWGSDSPYQVVQETYEDSISVIRDRALFLSESQKEQILARTAERVFFSK